MKGLTAQGNQFLWKVDTYIIFAGVLTTFNYYYYFKVIFIVWLFSIFIKCFFRRRLLLCNYYLDIIVTIFHPQVQPNMSQVFFFLIYITAPSHSSEMNWLNVPAKCLKICHIFVIQSCFFCFSFHAALFLFLSNAVNALL